MEVGVAWKEVGRETGMGMGIRAGSRGDLDLAKGMDGEVGVFHGRAQGGLGVFR